MQSPDLVSLNPKFVSCHEFIKDTLGYGKIYVKYTQGLKGFDLYDNIYKSVGKSIDKYKLFFDASDKYYGASDIIIMSYYRDNEYTDADTCFIFVDTPKKFSLSRFIILDTGREVSLFENVYPVFDYFIRAYSITMGVQFKKYVVTDGDNYYILKNEAGIMRKMGGFSRKKSSNDSLNSDYETVFKELKYKLVIDSEANSEITVSDVNTENNSDVLTDSDLIQNEKLTNLVSQFKEEKQKFISDLVKEGELISFEDIPTLCNMLGDLKSEYEQKFEAEGFSFTPYSFKEFHYVAENIKALHINVMNSEIVVTNKLVRKEKDGKKYLANRITNLVDVGIESVGAILQTFSQLEVTNKLNSSNVSTFVERASKSSAKNDNSRYIRKHGYFFYTGAKVIDYDRFIGELTKLFPNFSLKIEFKGIEGVVNDDNAFIKKSKNEGKKVSKKNSSKLKKSKKFDYCDCSTSITFLNGVKKAKLTILTLYKDGNKLLSSPSFKTLGLSSLSLCSNISQLNEVVEKFSLLGNAGSFKIARVNSEEEKKLNAFISESANRGTVQLVPMILCGEEFICYSAMSGPKCVQLLDVVNEVIYGLKSSFDVKEEVKGGI